jgi:hypothetical protein
MRPMEGEKVGRPKAQKFWRPETVEMASRIVREDVNARVQIRTREVV